MLVEISSSKRAAAPRGHILSAEAPKPIRGKVYGGGVSWNCVITTHF
jgi:hypothetical protein